MLGDELKQYVDNTYLINLDKRKDRLDKVSIKLKEHNIEFQRWPAIDGTTLQEPKEYKGLSNTFWNKGALGLVKTTADIIRDAKLNNYKNILILEDDVIFYPDAVTIFKDGINDIPQTYHMIFLGILHNKNPEILTKNTRRVKAGVYCHAYIINENIYDLYLSELEKEEAPIDVISKFHIQPLKESYALDPVLAYQDKNMSNISNRIARHDAIKRHNHGEFTFDIG